MQREKQKQNKRVYMILMKNEGLLGPRSPRVSIYANYIIFNDSEQLFRKLLQIFAFRWDIGSLNFRSRQTKNENQPNSGKKRGLDRLKSW